MLVFVGLGAVLSLFGLGLGAPVVLEYAETGLVPRLPSAVLAVSSVGLGLIMALIGLILHNLAKLRKQAVRLAYLSVPLFASDNAG